MNLGPSIGFGVFGLLFVLLYLGLLILFVYAVISAIQFFKRKNENDKELLLKLDSLIQLQTQKKDLQP